MSTLASSSVAPLRLVGRTSGVEVHLLRTRRFRTVHLHWLVEASLLDGRLEARALLPDLLTRGTASYPDLAALSARLEALYGTDLLASVLGQGERQVLRFGVETLADRFVPGGGLLAEVVDLLAEVLQRPPLVEGRFRADHLEQERQNLAHAIESLADDKPLHAYRRLLEVMHAGTPFAQHPWGSVSGVQALDEAAVHAAWDEVREQAPVRLMIVGDVSEAEALDTAGRLAAAQTASGPERRSPAEPARPGRRAARAVQQASEEQPLAQSRLAIGFRLPPERLRGAAAGFFATAFGGGSHARLFKRVREAESLAYGCSASALLDSGSLVVQAGIDAAQAERVQALVLEELERLARDGLDEPEFELSRRAMRRRLVGLQDSPAGLIGLALAGAMTGRASSVEQALAELEAVTPADVAAVASGCVLDSVFLLRGVGA